MQKGATLIEVLVALLLMTIAMISMAALQANALSYQTSSSARANAADLVIDITDRLRANLPSVPGPAGAPTTFSYTATWADQTANAIAAPARDCLQVACSSAERADYDMQTWRTKARQSLPQGSVHINGTIFNGMNVSLMWFDKEYKQANGTDLRPAPVCNAATDTVAQQQICCSQDAAVPAGVRCYNFRFLP